VQVSTPACSAARGAHRSRTRPATATRRAAGPRASTTGATAGSAAGAAGLIEAAGAAVALGFGAATIKNLLTQKT
jgi:hypothetical protein